MHAIRSAEVPYDQPKAYNEALKSRGTPLIWLDPTMSWHGQPNGKRGRSQTFSDEAIQFCLSIYLGPAGARPDFAMISSTFPPGVILIEACRCANATGTIALS
jgi:hypothetical protein